MRRRHARGLDAARPDAVERRHRRGHRTSRENLADLVDVGIFSEYGPLAVAAQRRHRPVQELMDATPADGVVLGIDTASDTAQCVVIGYDQTVLAGTQGYFGHEKTDRGIKIAGRRDLPAVLFAEGGGRPGEIDAADIASSYSNTRTFALLARLSGQVPLVGVLTGHCYAGPPVSSGSATSSSLPRTRPSEWPAPR